MLPKSCPRCGGWLMREASGQSLIELSCVICGWVCYRDAPARQRILSSLRSPRTAEQEPAEDSEPP
jgi:uncharacterized Zn finger protein (UPF0148 family)